MANPAGQYSKYVKPKLDSDPEFKRKYRQYINEHKRNKYASDEEYRDKLNERTRDGHRKRYNEDPVYRQKKLDDAKRRYQQKKAELEVLKLLCDVR